MAATQPRRRVIDQVQASLGRRYARERRFRLMGMAAVTLGLVFVGILFTTIVSKGYTAFVQTHIALEIAFAERTVDPSGNRDPAEIARADYLGLVKQAMRETFPWVSGRQDKRELYKLVSSGASYQLGDLVVDNPALIGTTQRVWLVADDDIDVYAKGRATPISILGTDGVGSATGTTGRIQVLSTANDFTAVLADVKRRLQQVARAKERDLLTQETLLDNAREQVTRLEADLAAARRGGDPATVAELETELASAHTEQASVANYIATIRSQIVDLEQRANTPGGEERLTPEMPSYLVAINGGLVKATAVSDAGISGEVLVPLASAAEAAPGTWEIKVLETPESSRRVKDNSIAWMMYLEDKGLVEKQFNTAFFSNGDSREPELAGIGGAAMGSLFTLLVTLLLSFPIGVAAAVYLEEFAPKNRWTDLIEVNINNLAAVPSIVFGLLGLAVFINFFGLPRSAPLVGGLVLTLMTLPTIIIASRAALKSVPPSIREAALGVGASKMQTIFHHVLPLAMPGMLTGTIIGMAQALGETAPLLMIGMVAFIVDIPGGVTDPATVLPVQIFLWADSPERAFVERTSAAIMVLLAFLIAMNAFAVVMRRRFERRW
ncbi:MAG: phosphate ABC transporter permease PstA [Gammaproteobacteria bacterium]